jgi:hypothetical protein
VSGDDQTHFDAAHAQIFCLIIPVLGVCVCCVCVCQDPKFVSGHHPSFSQKDKGRQEFFLEADRTKSFCTVSNKDPICQFHALIFGGNGAKFSSIHLFIFLDFFLKPFDFDHFHKEFKVGFNLRLGPIPSPLHTTKQ